MRYLWATVNIHAKLRGLRQGVNKITRANGVPSRSGAGFGTGGVREERMVSIRGVSNSHERGVITGGEAEAGTSGISVSCVGMLRKKVTRRFN